MPKLTEPYPYQVEGVRKIEAFNGLALLGDEQGLGKTLQIVRWIRDHLTEGPVVIVTPAHLKDNWEYEAWIHARIRVHIARGRKPPTKAERRLIVRDAKTFVLVINYDILADWLPFVYALRPTCVALDEAQMIKNRTAKRTKAVKKVGRICEYRIAATGTPVMSYPAELWSILNFCRPDLYPNFFDFASKYCNLTKRHWGWEYKGCKAPQELNKELRANLLIRRRKREVLKQLPPMSRHVVPVDMTSRTEYDKANKDFIGFLRGVNWSTASKSAKMEGLAKAGHLKRLAAVSKMDAVVEWIQMFLESSKHDKLLVGGIHKKLMLNPLHDKFRDCSILITGDVPSHKRHDLVKRFTNDKTCRVCFGNIHAAGTGWNGTAASTGLFVEFDWVPSNHGQMEARLDRIGQCNPVQWFWMYAKGTIEERMAQTLQARQGVVSSVLDGDAEVDKLPIYDQIIAAYQGKK